MFGQAYDHGVKTGIKDKVASILRAGMALMDTDSDNYVSAAELRTYAAKVPPMICFALPPLVSQRLPSVSSTAIMPWFERRHLLTSLASLDAAAENPHVLASMSHVRLIAGGSILLCLHQSRDQCDQAGLARARAGSEGMFCCPILSRSLRLLAQIQCTAFPWQSQLRSEIDGQE